MRPYVMPWQLAKECSHCNIVFYCYCQVSIYCYCHHLRVTKTRSFTLKEFCRFRAVVLGAAHVFLFDQDGRLSGPEAALVALSGALWLQVAARRLATTTRSVNHALGAFFCNAQNVSARVPYGSRSLRR